MEEIWKEVKGFEGAYEVSSLGRVRSYLNNRHGLCNKPKIIKGSIGGHGYYALSLFNPITQKRVRILIHRLVALSFIPNPNNKPCVDHINTIRTDNRACNLRWVTVKENSHNSITYKKTIEQRRQYGKINRGSNNKISKPISQFTKDNVFVCSYGSILEASEKTGIKYGKIRHNVHGEQKYADGFIFKFKQ